MTKSITSVLKLASSSVSQKGKILTSKIRELEEIEKRKFIAFVDDGPDSFDVSIQLTDDAKGVAAHSCDCGDPNILCPHQYAVLTNIKNGPSKSVSSITIKKLQKKKLSEVEVMIDEVNETELKKWLLSELETNKELEFKFKSAFQTSNSKINSKEFKEKFNEIIKTILGKRRTIDLSVLPRILELFNLLIEKTHVVFKSSLNSKESFSLQIEIGDFHKEINNKLAKSTTRVATNLKKSSEKITSHILLLAETDQVLYFLSFGTFLEKTNKPLLFALQQFSDIIAALSNKVIVDVLVGFSSYETRTMQGENRISAAILDAVIERHLFTVVASFFTIAKYENAYNHKLISLLAQEGKHKTVIEFCDKCIKSNFHEVYNIPYLHLKIVSLEALGKFTEVIESRQALFAVEPNYENYLNLKSSNLSGLQEEALEQQVTKFKLHPHASNYYHLLNLKFSIWMNSERELEVFKKIRNDIVSVVAAIPFMERLHAFDDKLLLKNIMKGITESMFHTPPEEITQPLTDFLLGHYTKKDLEPYVISRFYSGYKYTLFKAFNFYQ